VTVGDVFRGAVAEFVAAQRVGYLATVYPDGGPHVVPISTVLDLDRLVFASDAETQKVLNLREYPRAAVAYDEYHEDWSQLKQVVAHGRAMILDRGLEFERDRQLLYDAFPQYEQESPITEGESVVVEIAVDRVFTSGL
jgi:nitroimidazol reductase NimA-like FMN-containing flavoprotein (pyridoxamine 5'-phosphate oxidase superfamily)